MTGWAIVEVFGHQVIAGVVSEVELAGVKLVRVDVPEIERTGWDYVETYDAWCKLLGGASIFSVTPCSEAVAREAAAKRGVVNPAGPTSTRPLVRVPQLEDHQGERLDFVDEVVAESEAQRPGFAAQVDAYLARRRVETYSDDDGEGSEGCDDGPIVRAPSAAPGPIPMVLFCPRCGLQHVDQAQPERGWDNPPHRSHQCQGCLHVWRPCDWATVGVEDLETHGTRDSQPPVRTWAVVPGPEHPGATTIPRGLFEGRIVDGGQAVTLPSQPSDVRTGICGICRDLTARICSHCWSTRGSSLYLCGKDSCNQIHEANEHLELPSAGGRDG